MFVTKTDFKRIFQNEKKLDLWPLTSVTPHTKYLGVSLEAGHLVVRVLRSDRLEISLVTMAVHLQEEVGVAANNGTQS